MCARAYNTCIHFAVVYACCEQYSSVVALSRQCIVIANVWDMCASSSAHYYTAQLSTAQHNTTSVTGVDIHFVQSENDSGRLIRRESMKEREMRSTSQGLIRANHVSVLHANTLAYVRLQCIAYALCVTFNIYTRVYAYIYIEHERYITLCFDSVWNG